MSALLAIDPGTTHSAYVVHRGDALAQREYVPNDQLLRTLRNATKTDYRVAVEMIACYGMPVGKETFETCLLIGRILEIADAGEWPIQLVYRKDVKLFLCQSMRAKDGNVRQALIDKYGAPGTKAKPGFTYGISKHLWSALAIADYALNNPNP